SRYGSPTSSEVGQKIIRAQVGNRINTFPGDFIIAGSTQNPSLLTSNQITQTDGYILRVSSTFTLVWDKQYGGAGGDYFYGVDEVPPGQAGAGDIVAAGGSNSPPLAVGTDVFVVRANGNNGTLVSGSLTNLPPNSLNEEARSIIILRNGPNV